MSLKKFQITDSYDDDEVIMSDINQHASVPVERTSKQSVQFHLPDELGDDFGDDGDDEEDDDDDDQYITESEGEDDELASLTEQFKMSGSTEVYISYLCLLLRLDMRTYLCSLFYLCSYMLPSFNMFSVYSQRSF